VWGEEKENINKIAGFLLGCYILPFYKRNLDSCSLLFSRIQWVKIYAIYRTDFHGTSNKIHMTLHLSFGFVSSLEEEEEDAVLPLLLGTC
jgi:hypothetical protein